MGLQGKLDYILITFIPLIVLIPCLFINNIQIHSFIILNIVTVGIMNLIWILIKSQKNTQK